MSARGDPKRSGVHRNGAAPRCHVVPPSASYGRLMPRGAGFCRVFGGAFNVIPENRLLLDTAPAGANLRPVRSGLRPPPSSLANLYRDETRAGFPYGFRGFCQSQGNTRRVERAQRAALSLPVSDLDFRGERLRRRLPRGCSVYATVATDGRSRSVQGDTAGAASGSPLIELVPTTHGFTGDLGGVRSSDLICQHLAVARMARTVDLTVDIPKATRHPEASQEARKSR